MDTISLASVGGAVLAEGIKFLYHQAGEVLRRRAERRRGEPTSDATTLSASEPPPGLFKGEVRRLDPDMDVVERLEGELRESRKLLQEYGEGIELPDPAHDDVVRATDALRKLLEAVFVQRLTLSGEDRSPSGPLIAGSVVVDDVAGYAAAVRAEIVRGGTLHGQARAEHVEREGRLIGVDVKRLGD